MPVSWCKPTPICFPLARDERLLVDFGDLYGEALEAIRQSGPAVVQIKADDGYDNIVRKIFSALGQAYDDNPSFLAVPGAGEYNTVITVAGVMLPRADNQSTLLTGASLHAAVSELVSANGVAIVQW